MEPGPGEVIETFLGLVLPYPGFACNSSHDYHPMIGDDTFLAVTWGFGKVTWRPGSITGMRS
jgi:hypothetical protein